MTLLPVYKPQHRLEKAIDRKKHENKQSNFTKNVDKLESIQVRRDSVIDH